MLVSLLVCCTFGIDDATKALDGFIARQVEEHRFPHLSIAIVDRDKILWSKHYGKAVPETVYRVGSVSKMFTDLAVMQLVEQELVDLGRPISSYAPDFVLADPRGKTITLRHLMSHRAGLVREPPLGSYFDAEVSSLDKTIESLAKTTLTYPVGTRTKYSNAGIGLVGHVLEKLTKKKFPTHLREAVLEPLGMKASSFEPTDAVKKHLAKAVMWTYPGREFTAPTFELGEGPAGCMYSTVGDQARFLRMLLNKGMLDGKRIFAEKTLEAMWTPQFTKDKEGFGLGFFVGSVQGKRVVRHGGAIYGFATDFVALPESNLAVIVVTSRDCANAVMTRISNEAVRQVLASRDKKPLPAIEESTPLTPEEARAAVGHYDGKPSGFELFEQGGKLFFAAHRGGFISPVKKVGKALIVDGTLQHGPKMQREKDGLRIGKESYKHRPAKMPAPCPAKWRGLIGEYGPDHLPTVILERDGRLCAMVEWFFLYPLSEESPTVFRFDDTFGMYHGEKTTFEVDKSGKATKVIMGGLPFARRRIPGEETGTFKIKPLRPVADLRKDALKATPPPERDVKFREADLLELTSLDKTIQLDVRYATKDNFLGEAVYTDAKVRLQRPAAEALVRVHRALAKKRLGLRLFDGFRPWWVTHVFWHATPAPLRVFVADPMTGSRHNRGCAIDLTLFDRKTGKPIEMPGNYDEFSDRSYPPYLGGTSLQRYYRDVLRRAMEAEGFTVYEAEWWHFDYKDWRKYPIGN